MKYKLMNEEIFILRSRDTIFVFKSAYEPNSEINKVCWFETNSRKICWWWKYRNISEDGLNLNLCDDFDCHCFQEMGAHLVAHGDGVKDVAFSVEDLDGIMITCKKKGVRWYDGWHDVWHDGWHVWLTRRLAWWMAWWLTETEGVGLDESMVRENPLTPNQSHAVSQTKYILWSSLHAPPALD